MFVQIRDQVADAIATVIKEGEAGVPKSREIVRSLTEKYPLRFE